MSTDEAPDGTARAYRLADLARVAEQLSAAPTQEAVFEILASGTAPVIGMDYAEVSILRGDRLTSARRGWPFDPELTARYADTSVDAHLPTAEAARRRELVVVEDLEAYQASNPEVLADVRAARIKSMAALPLLDPKGDVLGVLGVISRRRVQFDEETTGAICLLGELCGNALRRIQLGVRAGQMATLAMHVSRAATQEEVASALRDHGVEPVGAVAVRCHIVNRLAGTLEPVAPPADAASPTPADATFHLGDEVPLAAAARSGEPIWLLSPDEHAARFPAAAASARAAGWGAFAALPLRDREGTPIGVLGIAWRNAVTLDELIRASILTIADLAGQSLERARLTDARVRAAQRGEAVARLGQVVSTAATIHDGATLLAGHAAGIVEATTVEVALADGTTGGLRIVGFGNDHASPPALVLDAYRSGERQAQETHDAYRLAVPLRAGEQEPMGVLVFTWPAPHAADDDELAIVNRIAALGARTLERTRTAEERTRDARTLADFAGALAAAVRRPEVAEAVAELVPPMLRAQFASLAVLDATGRTLEHLALRGLPDEVVRRSRLIPVASRTPAADAYRADTTKTFASRAELVATYPNLVGDSIRTGIESTAHVVVRDAANRPIGVVSVGWPAPSTFDDTLLARLEAVGRVVGQTLERADLYDAEHQLVIAMQQRLLAAVPRVASVDVATRYLPAADAVGIGGDWFDVVPQPHGFTLVVGDVTGHGVEAVTAMAQVRTLIAGLVRAGEPLEDVFARADTMLDKSDPVLASVELFEIDTTTWQLRYASAGHPWALLRRADASVEVLDSGQHALIGAPPRRAEVPTLRLDEGDVLVAYTDGLVERRNEPITVGIDRLVERLGSVPAASSAEEIAEELLDASGVAAPSAGRDDDVALVVLRRTTNGRQA